MYVVLMAMLALNVSNEVLNGFSIVEESLKRTTQNATMENLSIYDDFAAQMKANPQKVKQWYDKSQKVKKMSDNLYNLVDELKQAIVVEADGKDGDVQNIRNKEDLEAANQVMLAPGRGRGQELYEAINAYRASLLPMLTSPRQKKLIVSNLTTEVPENVQTMGKNWQEYMFEAMPAAAAVTLLSKLQNDVRYAEGEVLHTLVQNIDVKDIRVNALEAFVIPNSQTIVRGDKFSAHIVMAAVDTTQVPDIYIGNQKVTLQDNLYERICNTTGDFTLAGFLETVNGNGERVRRDFSQKYTVVDPQRHRLCRPHEHALCRLQQPHQRQCAWSTPQQGAGHDDQRHVAARRPWKVYRPSFEDRRECHHHRHLNKHRTYAADGHTSASSLLALRCL